MLGNSGYLQSGFCLYHNDHNLSDYLTLCLVPRPLSVLHLGQSVSGHVALAKKRLLKRIDREGLGESRTGSRQPNTQENNFQKLFIFFLQKEKNRWSNANLNCSSEIKHANENVASMNISFEWTILSRLCDTMKFKEK